MSESQSSKRIVRRRIKEKHINAKSFPPLSTTLKSFLRNGSDSNFRHLIYSVLTVSSLMLKSREIFAAYIGVTAPQYSIMVIIGEASEATVGQIADRLHVSSPFVTAEIGKLLKREIVAKRPNMADRRSMILTLTPTGQQLIHSVGPIRQFANDTIFGSLKPEQARQFADIMDILLVDAQRALYDLNGPGWKPKRHRIAERR